MVMYLFVRPLVHRRGDLTTADHVNSLIGIDCLRHDRIQISVEGFPIETTLHIKALFQHTRAIPSCCKAYRQCYRWSRQLFRLFLFGEHESGFKLAQFCCHRIGHVSLKHTLIGILRSILDRIGNRNGFAENLQIRFVGCQLVCPVKVSARAFLINTGKHDNHITSGASEG
jgi:hypothetical protein